MMTSRLTPRRFASAALAIFVMVASVLFVNSAVTANPKSAVDKIAAGQSQDKSDAKSEVKSDRKKTTDKKTVKPDQADKATRNSKTDKSNKAGKSDKAGKPDKKTSNKRSSRWPFQFISAEEAKKIITAVEKTYPELAKKLKYRLGQRSKETPKDLTKEQIESAFIVLDDRQPALSKRIRETYKKRPDRVKSMLLAQWQWISRAIRLKKSDPTRYALETTEVQHTGRARLLASQYRQANARKQTEKAAQLKQQLNAVVIEQVKARQKLREYDIALLKKRIEQQEKFLRSPEQQKKTAARIAASLIKTRQPAPKTKQVSKD